MTNKLASKLMPSTLTPSISAMSLTNSMDQRTPGVPVPSTAAGTLVFALTQDLITCSLDYELGSNELPSASMNATSTTFAVTSTTKSISIPTAPSSVSQSKLSF